MLATSRVSLSASTATLLHTATGHTKVTLSPYSLGATFYVGPDNTLTASNGFYLIGFGGSLGLFSVELNDGDSLYGYCDGGTATISVLTAR